MRPFPIYPLYTRTVILSLDKPIADCFLFRPRKSREKRRKRSHTNVSSTLSTRSSTPPAQTPQHSFQGAAAGTHATPVPNRAHSGSQGETGVLWMGALSLPSDRFARSGNPAWPEGRTAYFAPFGSWPRVLPKNAESLRNSDALMRVAVPRRRGPAGLRRPTPPAERTVLAPISPRVQLCLRRPAFPLSAFIPGA